MPRFDRSLIAAGLLVIPLALLATVTSEPASWLRGLAAGLGLTTFFYLVQRGIQRLGRGWLRREIALGALLQPLAAAVLVTALTLSDWLLRSNNEPGAGLPADPDAYRPFTLASELTEVGISGLASLGSWALAVCGLGFAGMLFALLYPPLRDWLQRP